MIDKPKFAKEINNLYLKISVATGMIQSNRHYIDSKKTRIICAETFNFLNKLMICKLSDELVDEKSYNMLLEVRKYLDCK